MNLARARRRLLALERYDERDERLGAATWDVTVLPAMGRARNRLYRAQRVRRLQRECRELDKQFRRWPA